MSAHREWAAPSPGADGARISRGRLLRRIAAGAGSVAGGGAFVSQLASAASPRRGLAARDREVLEFALSLERLQTAFYAEALRRGRLTGEVRQFAELVAREERAHLRYLERELHTAAKAGHYRFGDAMSDNRSFVAAAVRLEETGLAAYNGQATNLSRQAIGPVARVISVEARHAAWARGLAGRQPAPAAADVPISAAAAMKAIQPYLA